MAETNTTHLNVKPFLLLGILLFLLGTALAFIIPEISPDPILSTYFGSRPFPTLIPTVTFLTHLNSPPALLVYLFVLLGILLFRKEWRRGLFALLTLAGTALGNSYLKFLISRPRPSPCLIDISSPSFPSWHSATSAALALMLWILFVQPLQKGKVKNLLSLLLFLWPLIIGSTRLFLNAHWLSDIVAGWGMGIAITASIALLLPPNVRQSHITGVRRPRHHKH